MLRKLERRGSPGPTWRQRGGTINTPHLERASSGDAALIAPPVVASTSSFYVALLSAQQHSSSEPIFWSAKDSSCFLTKWRKDKDYDNRILYFASCSHSAKIVVLELRSGVFFFFMRCSDIVSLFSCLDALVIFNSKYLFPTNDRGSGKWCVVCVCGMHLACVRSSLHLACVGGCTFYSNPSIISSSSSIFETPNRRGRPRPSSARASGSFLTRLTGTTSM